MADLKTGSAVATVYDSLKKAIFLRTLRPGMQLTEKTLSESLNVGRSPIRRALQELANDGFVRLIPNKGAYVISYTKEAMIQLYAIKNELEIYAISLTIDQYTGEDIAFLENCLALQLSTFSERNLSGYLDAIIQFNCYIVDKAENIYLSEIYRSMMNKLAVCLALYDNFYVTPGKRLASFKNHEKIILSLRDGKGKKAAKLINELSAQAINSSEYAISLSGTF